MRYNHKFLATIIFSLLSPVFVHTQTFIVSNGAIIRSDSSSKFTLISNLFNKRGDSSQLLATGIEQAEKELLECRSLLAFDFSQLSPNFKAENISKATLVLFPMQLENEELSATNKFASTVTIKRITTNWYDSLTRWTNQPLADENNLVTKKIPADKKDDAVEINVTKLVRKMLKEGNNGFLIGSTEPGNKGGIAWFASSRNIHTIARPILLIELLASARTLARTSPVGTPLANARTNELDRAYQRDLIKYRNSRNQDLFASPPINPSSTEHKLNRNKNQ